MDDELRDDCCDEACDGGEKPCCDEAATPDGLLSVNTTGDGLMYSNGITTSGTFSIGCDTAAKTKMKNVIIKEMDHGYLVKIGCQTLCIESPKKLLKALKKYMKDPGAVEDQHMGGEFMKSLD